LGYGSRFRLVLVEQGAGIVVYGDKRHVFSGPAMFCLSETEKPQLTEI